MFDLSKLLGFNPLIPGWVDFIKGNQNFDIQGYIEKVLKQSLEQMKNNQSEQEKQQSNEPPNNEPKQKKPNTPYEVFRTHDYDIVRIRIPDNVNSKNIRVSNGQNKIIVRGVEDASIEIMLPDPIKKEGITAVIKNKILEIKAPIDDRMDLDDIEIKTL